MDATELRACRAQLREAGAALRARPLDARVEALGAALESLRDETAPATARLLSALPAATGLDPRTTAHGFSLAQARWGAAGLARLVADELSDRARARHAPSLTAVVPAGCIPMPTFEAMLAPLVLGSAVLVRPGSRDRVSADGFRRALADVDAALAEAVAIAPIDRDDADAWRELLDADAIVASGDDDTIAALRASAPRDRRFVGYGHRLSVAVLGPEVTDDAAAGLALDASLWDQLGCLSPIAAYTFGDADAWADALARALAGLAERWPRGTVPLASAAAIRSERAAAELRGASDRETRVIGGDGWVVVRESDARARPAPLHRFVRVHPVRDADELARALDPLVPHLSTVGHVGLEDGLLGALPGPRKVALGTMQTPPLSWNHDGIGTLRPLVA